MIMLNFTFPICLFDWKKKKNVAILQIQKLLFLYLLVAAKAFAKFFRGLVVYPSQHTLARSQCFYLWSRHWCTYMLSFVCFAVKILYAVVGITIGASDRFFVRTMLKLYQCCILSTLLYGSECWWVTEHDLAKLSFFHTVSLRKIQCIFWPRTISNHDLLARCQQEDMETITTRKQWRWIGHMLHKDVNSITKVAIHWTLEGKWKHGRRKTTWWRTVEVEMKKMNHSWGTIQRLASDWGGGGEA